MKKERKKKYTTAITKTEGLRLLGTHRERPKVLCNSKHATSFVKVNPPKYNIKLV